MKTETVIKSAFFIFLVTFLMGFTFVPFGGTAIQEVTPTDSFPQSCVTENTSFQAGERLVYKLYYNWGFIWMSAGEIVMTVEEEDGQYHLVAKGRTYKSYDWFYNVRDKYECYVDKETLLPTVSVRDVKEGDYELYDKIIYDFDNQYITSIRGDTEYDAKSKSFEMSGCVQDMVSAIYQARNFDFDSMKKNERVPMNIFLDREEWPLSLKYKGKERKKIKGLGYFNTIKFQPEIIIGDVFKEGTEMYVWATDDDNRIPLMIESPIRIGSVKAVLVDYDGLKHPMTAKD